MKAEIPPIQDDQTRYSAQTMDKALEALRKGLVELLDSKVGRVKSLTSPVLYFPAAVYDENGKLLGVSCTCPNGRLGGPRARCYHALALELKIEEERE